MKLYYAPGACSLAAHIVLREAGYAFDLEKVNLRSKKTETGIDFNTVSEKSAVPLLLLDNGETVSEASVIVQYLADQKPESGLAPPLGTFERVRLNEWLNFIATEIHKSFFPFIVGMATEAKEIYRRKLNRHFAYIAGKLEATPYLTGEQFTIVDAYLYTLLTWTGPMGVDISAWPMLGEYMRRIEARPKVREARTAEGFPEAAAT
ncbi:glutathione transferase GstA [Nitrosospira sp. NpAV]|uniref:glutathione transferase GstA n=1 Tax=Nitrosospira sp. NpAV TaxID=58133 RepID=UPI0005A169B2|nr:glutathione transferase GstA [Nitrosospira sp. NpAV]KIO48512.1 glutathione S-transferase [Nitrosospira sp. NpAV]